MRRRYFRSQERATSHAVGAQSRRPRVIVMSPTPTMLRRIAVVHLVSTWFMVGLIWTIHTVHYPLFAEVGASAYPAFQAAHVDRIGRLLAAPWALEGVSAAVLVAASLWGGYRSLRMPAVLGALAMGVVLVISGFWSAPAHGDLADGFDAAVHARLMDANLVRTIAWTVRGGLAVWVLAAVRSPHDRTP